MKFQYVTGEFPTKRGDPPPKKRSAPEPGKVGANQVQIKKFKQADYKRRPCLLQAGGAR